VSLQERFRQLALACRRQLEQLERSQLEAPAPRQLALACRRQLEQLEQLERAKLEAPAPR
jgi:hypothetical protein